MNGLSDLQLIDATVAGDTRAYDALVQRYQDRLVHSLEHALSSREEALDVAQQAFILGWRKLSTYRREAQFYSWLYRIARNVATSRIRRQTIKSGSLDQLRDDAGFEPLDTRAQSAPEHQILQAEEIQRLQAALKEIPEEFRQPLILKELDGMSYEEIAHIMDVPIGTVRSRIFRARQELLERLKRLSGNSTD
ncbi:MAG: sigma-70 family RNA polymerase sigma factor [Planctomycetaceae bacterium]|nr:sigma-70 family RNA polymerase sigma factor [Planctomycetaceae bacterium]